MSFRERDCLRSRRRELDEGTSCVLPQIGVVVAKRSAAPQFGCEGVDCSLFLCFRVAAGGGSLVEHVYHGAHKAASQG